MMLCRRALVVLALVFGMASAAAGAEVLPGERRSYVTTSLGQLHVMSFAPRAAGDRVPLVLLPETTMSAREYLPFAREMARDRRVIAVDLPGYGGSDAVPEGVTVERYAEAIADALAAQRIRENVHEFDVMGTHDGSLIAAELALAHPDLVRRLVLAGVVLENSAERELRSAGINRSEPFPATVERLRAGMVELMANDPGLPEEELWITALDSLRSYTRRWYLFDASTRYRSDERLPGLKLPLLVIAFDDDVRAATLRAAGTIVPAPAVKDMAPVGRLPYYRAAGPIAAVVREFLDGARP